MGTAAGARRAGDAPQRPKPLTASTLQQAASALAAAVGVGNGAIAQKLHEAGEDHLHASNAMVVAPEAQAAARRWLTAA